LRVNRRCAHLSLPQPARQHSAASAQRARTRAVAAPTRITTFCAFVAHRDYNCRVMVKTMPDDALARRRQQETVKLLIQQRFLRVLDVFGSKGPSPNHDLWRTLVDLQNDVCEIAVADHSQKGTP
jgi:hypothetical protein